LLGELVALHGEEVNWVTAVVSQ